MLDVIVDCSMGSVVAHFLSRGRIAAHIVSNRQRHLIVRAMRLQNRIFKTGSKEYSDEKNSQRNRIRRRVIKLGRNEFGSSFKLYGLSKADGI